MLIAATASIWPTAVQLNRLNGGCLTAVSLLSGVVGVGSFAFEADRYHRRTIKWRGAALLVGYRS